MAAKFDLVVAAKTVGAGSIKRLGNSMQGVQGRVKNLRMAMSGLNKTFATLGLILSAGAFVRMVQGAINAADAFGKLEDQTGIAANTLQAYVNAGKLAGVSQETIEKGLRRLSQSMREADQGVATYKDSFDALGISVRDTDGTLKTNQEVLGEISDRFAQMENGATKAAIAMEIFGRSGSNLINLLNGGSASLEEFNFEVSDNFAQNAEFFNDQIASLGIKLQGFTAQMADNLLPTLNNLVGMFSNITEDGADLTLLFDSLAVILKTVASTVFTVVAGFRFLGSTVVSVAKAAFKAAKFDFGGAVDELKNGLAVTNEQLQKDLKIFKNIWEGAAEAPESYFNDADEGLNRAFGKDALIKLEAFKKGIQSVGSAFGDVVVKGIKGMEDALVDFVTKGTINFRNLANSIISDMVRIAIQQTITRPFTNFINGVASNAAQVTNVAAGNIAATNVQAAINELDTEKLANNVSATDRVLGRSTAGAGAVEEIACTAAGRALIDDADAAAQRTTLGLVIGTDVQAFDADNAVTDANQTFTASQRGTITAVTVAAGDTTEALDFENGTNNWALTLENTASCELSNPANLANCVGQTGSIFVIQDATGSRILTYGNAWDFIAGTAPTLSTAANAVDRIDYVVRSGTSIHAVFTANYS